MKLQHFHFQTPERPKEEDYTEKKGFRSSPIGLYTYRLETNQEAFNVDLQEWKRLYGDKPEPEWISLKQKKPKKDQSIIWKYADENTGDRRREVYDPSDGWRVGEYNTTTKDYLWCDAQTYDTRLAEWKYHRVRYPGWTEQQGEDYAFVKENEKVLVEITFTKHSLKIQKCINGEWEPDLYYGEIPSLDLFELICKENGIEL